MAAPNDSLNRLKLLLCNSFKAGLGVDLRSLALLRIGLAILILVDLAVRCSDLRAHYTDFGVLPRSVVIDQWLDPWQWSIHLLSGLAIVQLALLVVAALAAVALLVGYKTRWATILSWILLVSLHHRNPLVLNSGDVEFRLILFWCTFLPLGARYSLDRVFNTHNPHSDDRFFSGGTIALTFQVCLVYWCAWAFKTDPIWTTDGTAAYYALSIDQFVTPIGHLFYQFPGLMNAASFITLWIEGLGPFLLFIPYKNSFFRTVCVFLFISLHMGFHLGLYLGIFPFVSAIAWLAFLPGQVWDNLSVKFTKFQQSIQVYYVREHELLIRFLQVFLVLPWIKTIELAYSSQINAKCLEAVSTNLQQNQNVSSNIYGVDAQEKSYVNKELYLLLCNCSPLRRYVKLLLVKFNLISFVENYLSSFYSSHFQTRQLPSASIVRTTPWGNVWNINQLKPPFAIFFLVCILLWNFAGLPDRKFQFPEVLTPVIFSFELSQKWDMFAPFPLTEDGWYVIPAQLHNGQEIDLFQGGQPVTWHKPQWVARTYKNQRWRKYMMNLWEARHEQYRLYYGRYLCRSWNNYHSQAEQVETFRIIFMLEKTLPDYKTSGIEAVEIWNHNCF